ncbi:MAG: NitT/TauT family transport system substrate-binding protein [Bradyrhizobium sp.]|nr:NitT/TauT family transport system substrate-binding protein [Bradyrhizobium sp.]
MKPHRYGVLLLTFAAMCFSASSAHAADKLRLLMDWAFQGQAGAFVNAVDNGYFASQNLDVSIDRGYGSSDAITKLASGSYDIAFGDINSMMEFNTKNPDKPQLIATMMVFDRPPLSIMTFDPSIKTPKDLEGKKIVTSQGESNLRLFPLLAKLNGIDRSKVTFVNVQPQLRESLMMRGEGNAVTGFYYASYESFKALGADMPKLKTLMYADFGMQVYGNAVIASKALADSKPDIVRRFNLALINSLRDAMKKPEIVAPLLKKRDPTIVESAETERFEIVNRDFILTPYVKKNGFGDIDRTRMEKGIDQVTEALELPRRPRLEEVFTNAFLPPADQRMLP